MTGGKDRLIALLQRAGLEVVEDRRIEEVMPPRAAWRPAVPGGAKPTVAVRNDLPDLIAELNAQWHRLAAGNGIIGEDSVFLINVAGHWTGCAPRRWTRVRLTGRWDLATVLGERPEQPEFVTLATDGSTLVGVTTEEDEVRFTLLAPDAGGADRRAVPPPVRCRGSVCGRSCHSCRTCWPEPGRSAGCRCRPLAGGVLPGPPRPGIRRKSRPSGPRGLRGADVATEERRDLGPS